MSAEDTANALVHMLNAPRDGSSDGPSTSGGEDPARPPRSKRQRQRPPHRPAGNRSCSACGATVTPQWRVGPGGPNTLCNACGTRHTRGLPLERPRRTESRAPPPPPPTNVKSCSACGTQHTPQWRSGPDGPSTLCNACGARFLKGLSFDRPRIVATHRNRSGEHR